MSLRNREGLKFILDVILGNFWANVKIGSGCWEWTGRVTRRYGLVRGVGISAHRFAWIIANGPVPDGLYVLHECDNRLCVRPSHLFLGTAKDNRQDAMRKGRANFLYGEKHQYAVLTNAQAEKIRFEWSGNKRGMNATRLSEKYNVSLGIILGVVKRETYVR